MSVSEAFSISFIKLYYTKALSDQDSSLALGWILLLWRPRIPVSLHDSATTFHTYHHNFQSRLLPVCVWSFMNIFGETLLSIGFPWWFRGQSLYLQCRRPGFHLWVKKIPWRRNWQPTSVFLPGESHGQRSLVGYSPRGRKESDMIERLHFHFTLLSISNLTSKNGLQISQVHDHLIIVQLNGGESTKCSGFKSSWVPEIIVSHSWLISFLFAKIFILYSIYSWFTILY